MKMHVIGDATERAFSRGQTLLAGWSFDEALGSFDAALALDPGYEHIRLHRALALAELGRLDEAITALRQVAERQPDQFVAWMYLGCIHFDENQLDAAKEAFAKATQLAPTNTAVEGYRLLCSYAAGDASVLPGLVDRLPYLPDGLKARTLLTLADWPKPIPVALESMTEAKRKVALLDLELALRSNKPPASPRAKLSWFRAWRLGAAQRRWRRLLIQKASLEVEDGARQRTLKTWIASYRGSGRPRRECSAAADVLVELASIAHRQGRIEDALRLCEESRTEAGSPEADWVEARLRATIGPRRHVRRLLERFAAARSLEFDARVALELNRLLQDATSERSH